MGDLIAVIPNQAEVDTHRAIPPLPAPHPGFSPPALFPLQGIGQGGQQGAALVVRHQAIRHPSGEAAAVITGKLGKGLVAGTDPVLPVQHQHGFRAVVKKVSDEPLPFLGFIAAGNIPGHPGQTDELALLILYRHPHHLVGTAPFP